MLDGLIYYPFLVLATNRSQAPGYLLKLFGEDASGMVNEHLTHREERQHLEKQLAELDDEASVQRVLKQLKGGEFIVYFQPKVDARSLDLVGLEVLLRFKCQSQKVVPPTFLPLLYRQGLSKMIDQQVVGLVFEQLARWRSQGLQYPPISINFDKDFLLDPSAIKDFIARAKAFDICFEIEITEHTYTVELAHLAQVVRQLRAAGHRISIDDFGAGYSSLTTLVALEADEIKLDRQLLLAPEAEAERGELLFRSSVKLCHDLGFQVVAEGMETSSQLLLVQKAGADVVQGYFTGRPMDAQQVSQLFAQPKTEQMVG